MDVQFTLIVQPVGLKGGYRFEEYMDSFINPDWIRQHKLEFFLPCDQLEGGIQVDFYRDRHGGIKPYLNQICDLSVCLLI